MNAASHGGRIRTHTHPNHGRTHNGAAHAHASAGAHHDRPRHAQRAAFDEFLKFMHPGIDTAAAAMKFLAALKDQIAFKGLKDVVWRLAKAAVASEQHSTGYAGPACPTGTGSDPSHAAQSAVAFRTPASTADVMEDKPPGLKRVEEFLRCAASNEAAGVATMVLPLLEALLGTRHGSGGGTGGGLIDRAMSDLLLQVELEHLCTCMCICLSRVLLGNCNSMKRLRPSRCEVTSYECIYS